jgi:hypothetical protein
MSKPKLTPYAEYIISEGDKRRGCNLKEHDIILPSDWTKKLDNFFIDTRNRQVGNRSKAS